MLSILWITSCSSPKTITFSNEKWSFSGVVGDIINSDSTLRFSFGPHALNPAMTLISCADSLSIHKDARKYITRILKVCGLENSTVYFYAPLENTMWVELPKIIVMSSLLLFPLILMIPFREPHGYGMMIYTKAIENLMKSIPILIKIKGMVL